MNKEAFITDYNSGYLDELQKIADLIPKQVYKDLPDYEKNRLVEAKQTIEAATKKTTKLPTTVREKMIEGAIESIKTVSWDMARASGPKKKMDGETVGSPTASKPKPPATL